jgi:hypothetical protein
MSDLGVSESLGRPGGIVSKTDWLASFMTTTESHVWELLMTASAAPELVVSVQAPQRIRPLVAAEDVAALVYVWLLIACRAERL